MNVKEETSHRPWPVPEKPWLMAMNWHDLLFMHWPMPAAALRPLVPANLEIDTFDSQAWLGITPFQMSGVRPRLVPALPWLSHFPELNVRTYVKCKGKPGVWFFSLDAAQWFAVQAARIFYLLPYWPARMSVVKREERLRYRSRRVAHGPAAQFVVTYHPTGPVFHAAPGSLEHWLTERYCLFAAGDQGAIYSGDIHHARWPLQPAEADIETNTMTQPLGFELPDTQPVLHYGGFLEVVAWALERCE